MTTVTGNTLEVQIVDPKTMRGIPNVTCDLYLWSTVILSGGTVVSGTRVQTLSQTSGDTFSGSVSGVTDHDGTCQLYDVGPYEVTVVARGTGLMTQIPKGYERIRMPNVFRVWDWDTQTQYGDVFVLHDPTGGTRYLWVNTTGGLECSTSFYQP